MHLLNFRDGFGPLPAVAELAPDGLAQPAEEAGDNLLVHAVHGW